MLVRSNSYGITDGARWQSGLSLVLALLLTSCVANNYEPGKLTKEFAPGNYSAVLSGSREAKIQIADDLSYRYVEDSNRNGLIRQVMRNGTLRFSDWRRASAGNVKLEWVGSNTIKVVSPFSSTIGHGNNQGNEGFSSGPFISGMPSHTFYMNRVTDSDRK